MRNKILVVLGLSLVIVLIFVGITLAYAAAENVAETACDTLVYPGALNDPYPTPVPPECSYLPVIQN